MGQVEWLSGEPDFAGRQALEIQQIGDQPGDMADLPGDHLASPPGRRPVAWPLLEDLHGAAERVQRRAQLVRERGEELVLRLAGPLGAAPLAVGLEELGQVGHDQVQPIGVCRRGRAEREAHGDFPAADEGTPAASGARLQQRGELGVIAGVEEALEAAAHHRFERFAHQIGEAGVRIQDVAAARQDERALVHLLDECPVGLLGAVQGVDATA